MLAILWLVMASLAYGEPPVQTKYSFSAVFFFSYDDIGRTSAHSDAGHALDGWFEPGLVVSAIDGERVCKTKTGRKFRFPIGVEPGVKATIVDALQDCTDAPFVTEAKFKDGYLAVIGVDPSAIRLIQPSVDRSPVSANMELRARQLATSNKKMEEAWPISKAPPQVTRVGNVTLLKFGVVTGGPGDEIHFFSNVVIIGGRLFRLEDRCTDDHLFFTVNGRLHLSFMAYCCGCGMRLMVVYDVSGATPQNMYESENFESLYDPANPNG